ncbi:MAG: hypothetical protein ACJ8HU_05915 [Chthoniobacterales bacterium]
MRQKGRAKRREIFVFTPEEKKAGACVLAAIVLGLATMHYRAAHPPANVKLTPKEEFAARRNTRTANARARSARSKATAIARTTPVPDDADEEE